MTYLPLELPAWCALPIPLVPLVLPALLPFALLPVS